MTSSELLPLAVGHMIGLGAIGSCIGIGLAVLIAFAFGAPATSFLALILAVAASGLVAWSWTLLCRRFVGTPSATRANAENLPPSGHLR